MPLFEYDCEECGHRFEALVFRPDEEVECPKCGSTRARKLLSTFATGGRDGGGSSPAPAPS